MTKHHRHTKEPAPVRKKAIPGRGLIAMVVVAFAGLVVYLFMQPPPKKESSPPPPSSAGMEQSALPLPSDEWIKRARAVTALFHQVYTPCWEGAYGALGDAYLFAATGDSSLLRFHLVEHDLRKMCEGTWVDDRAWVCLAELTWWKFTGKRNMGLVADAMMRYDSAKKEGRFSSHDGFWSWYNWPPHSGVNERVFTNSNMNQMVTAACMLYEATGERRYLNDALLAWNGDAKMPGIEKTYYRGNGLWVGGGGHAAFGNELPWKGTGYCSVAAALYSATRDQKYMRIAIATARHIMDPATGWVDPRDFYQLRMDGNGAFVHFLLDAYEIAPDSLRNLIPKLEATLQHVWTNNQGRASVTLHRQADHGIRNGWNPHGGEEGYGVGEVGTVHAQGEAARAFGVFAYFHSSTQRTP